MKSKYDTHVRPFLDRIAKWAENGASQAEIAGKLKLAVSTFKDYLSRGDKGEEPYKDLSDCFRRTCAVADDTVEASLYRSACGYNAPVKKLFKLKKTIYDEETGKKIRDEEILVEGIEEVHIPANVLAQTFWLTNRRPDKWRPAQKIQPAIDSNSEGGVVLLPEIVNCGGAADEQQ